VVGWGGSVESVGSKISIRVITNQTNQTNQTYQTYQTNQTNQTNQTYQTYQTNQTHKTEHLERQPKPKLHGPQIARDGSDHVVRAIPIPRGVPGG
jgi:hypothetical protein